MELKHTGKRPNSRTRRKFKCGFYGEGTNQKYKTNNYGTLEDKEFHTKIIESRNKNWYGNLVSIAKKLGYKHPGSKSYRSLKNIEKKFITNG